MHSAPYSVVRAFFIPFRSGFKIPFFGRYQMFFYLFIHQFNTQSGCAERHISESFFKQFSSIDYMFYRYIIKRKQVLKEGKKQIRVLKAGKDVQISETDVDILHEEEDQARTMQ